MADIEDRAFIVILKETAIATKSTYSSAEQLQAFALGAKATEYSQGGAENCKGNGLLLFAPMGAEGSGRFKMGR